MAIADAIATHRLDAEIAVVISNRADAPGIAAAQERGLRVVTLPSKSLDRDAYDRQLIDELRNCRVDLVCLAGYMRILGGHFIREFHQRILNIHPSLLPAFSGARCATSGLGAWRQVFRLHRAFRRRRPGFRPDCFSSRGSGARRRHARLAFRQDSEGRASDLSGSYRPSPIRKIPDRWKTSNLFPGQVRKPRLSRHYSS